MFSRYFFILCAFGLFAAVVGIVNDDLPEPQSQLVETEGDVEERNPALIVAVGILRGAFKWAAKHCLEQAAHNCKQHWKHARALIHCAKGFMHQNKGRCVAG